MYSFEFPIVEMPFPEREIASGLDAAEQGMWEWLDHHRLLVNESMRQHLVRTRPHYTVARYYPHASAAHLLAAAQYTAWAFIVDDVFDDAIGARDAVAVDELSAELIGVSLRDRDPSTDIGRALGEVLETLSAGRSPQCRVLLGDANVRWLRTYPVEAQVTAENRTMRFGEYVPHRRYGTDELLYIHLAEITLGVELPAEVRDLPAMAQARNRALEWIGLYNDIVSADKEAAVGYLHNAVLLVRQERGCSMQEAVDTINDVLPGLLGQFEAACAAVAAQVRAVSGNDPSMRDAALQVVDGYRQLIRGNFDYHIGTARYDEVPLYMPQAQAGGLRPGWTSIGMFGADDDGGRGDR